MFVDTKARPQGEQVDAISPTKMKLSEAIRVGIKLRGECRRAWRRPAEGTGCALVAACEATGLPYEKADYGGVIFSHLKSLYPGAMDSINLVPKLMDSDGYSREQVAAWFELKGL